MLPPDWQIVLQLIGLASAMILIAVCTDYLVSRLEESKAALDIQGRLLNASNERVRTVVEGIGHGVITFDKSGQVVSISQSSYKYFRVPCERLIGLEANEVLQHLALDQNQLSQLNLSASLIKDIAFNTEVEVAGNKLHLEIVLKPMIDADGEAIGTLLVIQDRTQERSLVEQLEMQERMARLLSDTQVPHSSEIKLPNFIGESPVMKKVFNLISRAAPTEATVLISGESGTGKELVARAIHLGSPRARFPFVAVNCGAIPENLIESELFGHKKGSFTSADSEHLGLVRHAEGGTLFLDEIGELPLQMQAKLLRMIQQRSVRPVGSERDVPINVRIVTATNKNLKRETEKELFREDLYYRLNVVNINLPPLRERKEDLPLLINHTIKKLSKNNPITPLIPPASIDLLLRYSYPGNVRELENILERAIVLGGEVILPEHLPDVLRDEIDSKEGADNFDSGSRKLKPLDSLEDRAQLAQQTQFLFIDEEIKLPINLDLLLADLERRYIEAAICKANGTRKHAAELLGMNFRSLRYRLQKFGIQDDL